MPQITAFWPMSELREPSTTAQLLSALLRFSCRSSPAWAVSSNRACDRFELTSRPKKRLFVMCITGQSATLSTVAR